MDKKTAFRWLSAVITILIFLLPVLLQNKWSLMSSWLFILSSWLFIILLVAYRELFRSKRQE